MAGTTWLTTEPRRQPKAEVNTKAAAEPRKTDHLEELSAAKQKVANWVLSPNSARKMEPKVVSKTLKSKLKPPIEDCAFSALRYLESKKEV